MATCNLMPGKHIPHFGLNSLIISTLSFGEIFSYFTTSWKLYCLTFWIGKKSRLLRWFFQYSVICNFSKYIRLAPTGFHKIRYFIGNVNYVVTTPPSCKINHQRKLKEIYCKCCFLCSWEEVSLRLSPHIVKS